MLFYVLQKLNNKECIIYDVKNGGVCCCTAYTLNQLVEMGHKIEGYDGKNIVEVDLQGKKRENKAPNMCEDLTKRSAVTIARGLDEKNYPRLKQNRKVMPEVEADNKGVLISLKDGTKITLHIGDIKKFSYMPTGSANQSEIVGIITQIRGIGQGNLYILDITTNFGKVFSIDSTYITAITSCRLDSKVRENLESISIVKLKINALNNEIKAIQKELWEEEAKLKKKYQDKIEVVSAKKAKLEAQLVNGTNVMAKSQGLVSKQTMKEAILKATDGKLNYKVVDDITRAGVKGETGQFELSLQYSERAKEWVVEFVARIHQRTGYYELCNSPYFYQEYDGTIVSLTRNELEKTSSWRKDRMYYIDAVNHNFKNGNVAIELGVDDAGKGWYHYNYIIEYRFKGKEQVTIEEFKKMLKEIY